jgi:hypothetical protein
VVVQVWDDGGIGGAVDVVYGSALWFSSTKLNCHHVTERLARRRPVLYVESVGARRPRAHEWRRVGGRLLRSFRPLRRLDESLWLYSPLPLPAYRGTGAATNSKWVGMQVRLMLALRRWQPDVCWAFHPMGYGTARAAKPKRLIYYCVDDHAANPGVDAHAIRNLEEMLVEEAHLTIATGEPLARRLRATARRLEVLPNVADTELFRSDVTAMQHGTLEAIDAVPRPRLGYLGNLASYKIDLSLLEEIARLRPHWSVVLVGPRDQGDVAGKVSGFEAPPNMHFFGEVPHAAAPAVIDEFDVCLLPASRHDVMQASFPLKFFEYLLRERPVVGRELPALEPFAELYRHADTAEEFVEVAEDLLSAPDPAARARAREAALGVGWTRRTEELEEIRAELLSDVV